MRLLTTIATTLARYHQFNAILRELNAYSDRVLADMGVDPALWLHALDTPPQALYYLSAEELAKYRLVTSAAKVGEAAL